MQNTKILLIRKLSPFTKKFIVLLLFNYVLIFIKKKKVGPKFSPKHRLDTALATSLTKINCKKNDNKLKKIYLVKFNLFVKNI